MRASHSVSKQMIIIYYELLIIKQEKSVNMRSLFSLTFVFEYERNLEIIFIGISRIYI